MYLCTLYIPFCFSPCLSIDVISLLCSLCVMSCEDIIKESSQPHSTDVTSRYRENYLTVVALLEIFSSMNYYNSLDLNEESRKYLSSLQNSVVMLPDLRFLFILLIRHWQPELHGKEYLADIVVANHEFLLLADLVMSWGSVYSYFDMHEHVCLFATQDTMLKYNNLLDDCSTNTSRVFNCAFTMMHHVAGDCQCPDVLLQIPIVQNFLNILDLPIIGFIPQECLDLIEYILHQCVGKLETNSLDCIRLLCRLDLDVEGIEKESEESTVTNDQRTSCSNQVELSQELEDSIRMLLSEWQDMEPSHSKISDITFEMQNMGINVNRKEVERYLVKSVTPDNTRKQESEELSLEECLKHLCEMKNDRWIHYVQNFLVELGHVKSGIWIKPASPIALHYFGKYPIGVQSTLVVYKFVCVCARWYYKYEQLNHISCTCTLHVLTYCTCKTYFNEIMG